MCGCLEKENGRVEAWGKMVREDAGEMGQKKAITTAKYNLPVVRRFLSFLISVTSLLFRTGGWWQEARSLNNILQEEI